ncbi:MAG TPA: RtcB family protein [Synergistaceae bacterium]|nr:RtcB family protein [Synergistaceae bacterium]
MHTYLERLDENRLLLHPGAVPGMRVPGMIYADAYVESLLAEENALLQVARVATLPGILGYSFGMPDIHWGYGFPIGGVAAFDAEEGIISPGGVGYDISCGVRLLASRIPAKEGKKMMPRLVRALFEAAPSGAIPGGGKKLSLRELEKVLQKGAPWAVEEGLGTPEDLKRIEEGGSLKGALPSAISERAKERGKAQLGTLGSGNHFLEIQEVAEIFDSSEAAKMGIEPGCLTVMIHCGSRGLGHQICDDSIKIMRRSMGKWNISVPDPQLCCVPLQSKEGQEYLGAMRGAANYAMTNRQIIAARVRRVFQSFFPKEPLQTVWDVSHNLAHMEKHSWKGQERTLCVHRKGATRAFEGEPVLIPGSMGTSSYVLVGTKRGEEETFGSTCHGAGRSMSRSRALKETGKENLSGQLRKRGIEVVTASPRTLGEEAPRAYKKISSVVEVVHRGGISLKIARLQPLGVMKG